MTRKFFIILFFKLIVVHSQQLEDVIYKSLDSFLANKTEEAFEKFIEEETEFESEVKAKSEHLALVILQCNKAFFFKQKNQIKQAIITYEKAWKRFDKEELSNYDITEYCLKPLGNLYTKTKDYANAEYLIKYYIALAEKEKNTSQKIAGIINLSKVYQSVNKHILVVNMIDEVLEKYEIKENQKHKLKTIKTSSLITLNVKADNDFVNKTTENLKNKDVYYLKYRESLKQKKYTEAESFLKKFKKEILKSDLDKRNKAKLFLEEAQIQILLKEEEKAEISLDSVLTLLIPKYKKQNQLVNEQLYAESLLIDVFDMKAIITSDIEKSLHYYDKSFYVSDLITQNITSQETKIIAQSNQRKRSEACISLLMKKFKKTKQSILLEKAFLYADIGKSDVLKTKLFKKKLWKEHPNDSLLQLEKIVSNKQEILSNEIIKEQVSTNDFNKITNLNKQLNVVSIELKQIQNLIKEKYPVNNQELASLDKIRERIGKQNEVLLMYFYGTKNIYQFIVDKSSIKVNTIKQNKTLEKAIVNYIQLFNSSTLINNDVNNYTQKAFELYEILKFNSVKPYENVILIPDGILNFVPFETLLTHKTEETFFTNMPFVVKEQKIVYNFNMSMFINATSNFENQDILGVFPVFKNTPQELKYSLEEAKIIENNFPATIFKNEKATKNNFINNLHKTSIIHLSTHSRSENYPNSSYISFFDEELTINELYAKETTANLVVLSACETGIGTLLKGASPLSIARGFNYIGVDNLLFSLWKINDKSTANIMKRFYNSFKEKNSVSYANHQSKIGYLKDETIENSKKSPYYWGAFVYYGTSDAVIQNQKMFYVVLVLLFLVIVPMYFIKKRIYK